MSGASGTRPVCLSDGLVNCARREVFFWFPAESESESDGFLKRARGLRCNALRSSLTGSCVQVPLSPHTRWKQEAGIP
jgi:hypothetical protein